MLGNCNLAVPRLNLGVCLDDFGRDTIEIDQMWARFSLPGADSGWASSLTGGKVENPFLWKNGADRIVWDGDISPEGLYLRTQGSLGGSSKLFATRAADASARAWNSRT